MNKFTGVMPALVTPLTEKNEINVPVLKKLIEFLLSQGAYGFYVGGATGEGISLSREQREILCTESINAINGKVPVIVHIASVNFNEAVELAKQAEKAGAAAISAIPPLFFGYSEDDVYKYYKKLAEAVSIPLLIYYNTSAGFKVNAEFAAKCFEVDNITGIKWTSSDYYGMMRLKDLTNGDMNIINGPDEMLLCGLAAGADGGIGTTYNVNFPIIKQIYENFKAGNIEKAREYQYKENRLVRVINPGIPSVKVILEKMGFEVGNAAFPMKRLDDEAKALLFANLKAAGYEF